MNRVLAVHIMYMCEVFGEDIMDLAGWTTIHLQRVEVRDKFLDYMSGMYPDLVAKYRKELEEHNDVSTTKLGNGWEYYKCRSFVKFLDEICYEALRSPMEEYKPEWHLYWSVIAYVFNFDETTRKEIASTWSDDEEEFVKETWAEWCGDNNFNKDIIPK